MGKTRKHAAEWRIALIYQSFDTVTVTFTLPSHLRTVFVKTIEVAQLVPQNEVKHVGVIVLQETRLNLDIKGRGQQTIEFEAQCNVHCLS